MTTNAALRPSGRTFIRRPSTLAFAAVAVLEAMLMSVPTAGAAATHHNVLTATYTSGPDTITSFRCTPAPAPSTCHGTAEGAATYTGGWSGTSHYAYRFHVARSGTVTVEIREQFAGTVEGCGTVTFTVLTHETIDPFGQARGRWVIPTGETDSSNHLTGTGTSTGSYTPNGAGSGQLTGRVHCPTHEAPPA